MYENSGCFTSSPCLSPLNYGAFYRDGGVITMREEISVGIKMEYRVWSHV